MKCDRPIARRSLSAPLLGLMFAISNAAVARAQPFDNCLPSAAADKPAPLAADAGPKNAFRIIWHIGTQIEDLADADRTRNFAATVKDIQSSVDGYYFLKLGPNGKGLGYWPGRPAECAINFMRAKEPDRDGRAGTDQDARRAAAADVQNACNQSFATAFPASATAHAGDAAGRAYADALVRVIDNLNIRKEQEHGKIILSEMLLANADFIYDADKDKLSLRRLPTTYCFLNSIGIHENNAVIYQEPSIQARNNSFLSIPANPASKPANSGFNPATDALPQNGRIVGLVGHAFAESRVPLSRFSINLRLWGPRFASNYRQLRESHFFGGYFFEAGTEIISRERRDRPRIDNFAEGIAWILANTDENIFLLMPGFWEKEQMPRFWETGRLDDEKETDQIIGRLRTTVTQLNEKIDQRLGLAPGRQAICNKRIYFILASYGSPVHVKTLPPVRQNGALAGTVTGQIKLMAQMRRELCGTSE